MKIILKEDIENLGRKGDMVDVAPGYGRNYLIPRKMALEVTSSNLKMIEIERAALKKKVEQERLSFQELIQKLNEISLTFYRKAGEKDVIFGSVSSSDIKEALDELGFDVDKKKILLDEPIKRLGNYSVAVKVYHDDRAEVKVEVAREDEEPKKKEKTAEKEPSEEKEKETKAASKEEKKGKDKKEKKAEEALSSTDENKPPAAEKASSDKEESAEDETDTKK